MPVLPGRFPAGTARAAAFAVVGMLAGWSAARAEPPPGAIGYDTVVEAFAALHADPLARKSTQRGWVLFERREGDSIEFWTFTPAGHPAYPSVARRTGHQDATGAWGVRTKLLCQSTKAACDALLEEYLLLDEQMKESIRRKHGGSATQ